MQAQDSQRPVQLVFDRIIASVGQVVEYYLRGAVGPTLGEQTGSGYCQGDFRTLLNGGQTLRGPEGNLRIRVLQCGLEKRDRNMPRLDQDA